MVRRLDSSEEGDDVIDAIAQHQAVEILDERAREFRITIAEARYPDEAIVQLASELDQIDPDWTKHLSWPVGEEQ